MDEINLHFTGDFHAISAANNLLACKEMALKHSGGPFTTISFVTKDAAVKANEKSQCYGIKGNAHMPSTAITGVMSSVATEKNKCTEALLSKLRGLESSLNQHMVDMENEMQKVYPLARQRQEKGKQLNQSLLNDTKKLRNNRKELQELQDKISQLQEQATDNKLKSKQNQFINTGLFLLSAILIFIMIKKVIH